jgi:dihydropteroate synthase
MPSPLTIDCGGRRLVLDRPRIMGILNVTPDSFSDGGLFMSPARALERAQRMVADGADMIDIGGESTRPGATPVSTAEELDRVIPVVEALRREIDVPISIDTSKVAVMRAAVAAGAGFINDVYALRADGAPTAAAELGVPVCLMHMQAAPATMQHAPVYRDVVREVREFLLERRAAVMAAGLAPERVVLDPGFGFGKTLDHNLALFGALEELAGLGSPLLVGLSRKSMIGQLLDANVDRRLPGSLALALLAIQRGASIVRVHDVGETRDVVRIWLEVAQRGQPEQQGSH